MPLARARSLLRSVFGFDDFRPGQEAIVSSILAGHDVLAIMPTGAGKSLCFQLPALVDTGVTVVVSPLIALMRDQVAQLVGYGIAAAALNSSNSLAENDRIFSRLRRGELRLLYLAPERLAQPETLEVLRQVGISRLAIDEAHCVSQWGHDFRPEYLILGEMRQNLGGVQTVAFTATADAATRTDVAARLFGSQPEIFIGSFDRPNLMLAMAAKARASKQILDFVATREGQSGIVYCSSRAGTEEMAQALVTAGHKALPYHAGMDTRTRSYNQDTFLREDGLIIVATVAFGMGIDKPDVRFVAHADLPKSIESYYQEIGRAGRDGLPADTLTLYGMSDIKIRRLQIEESQAPEDRKRIEHQKLNALLALCEAPRCRRQVLLSYFGESSSPCGYCDLCRDGVEVYDGTVDAQKALSAVFRTGQRFGTEHLVNILLGSKNEAMSRFGHDRLPTFGVGVERSRDQWRSIFRQLYAAGLLDQNISEYGGWQITDAGGLVLRGKSTIALRSEVLRPRERKPRERKQQRLRAVASQDVPSTSVPVAMGRRSEEDLLDAMKRLRRTLSSEQGVPAYTVFPDRTLIELSQRRPQCLEEMRGIHGIGEAKLSRYGNIFLEILREA